MRRCEVFKKYNLNINEFNMLMRIGKIVKNDSGTYEIMDEQYILNNDFAKYSSDYYNSEKYKAMISARNAKVNKHRWAAISEENRQKFSKKVSNSLKMLYKEHPEIVTKMRENLIKYWNDPEHRKEHSERMTEVYKDPSKRANISKGCKKLWEDPERRKAKSEYMLQYWKDHPESLERMRENNRKAQEKIWTSDKCDEQSILLKSIWAERRNEILAKMHKTMKENNTFNSSDTAEYSKDLLRQAGFEILEEYRYPNGKWKCDVYLPELDVYIEFHYGMFHGAGPFHEPFDLNNPEHLKQKSYLEQKYKEDIKSRYHYVLYTWTDLDVRKRQYAKEANLTWFAFYTVGEFKQWLETLLS